MDGLLFIGMHAALRGGLILRASEWAHAPAHTVWTKLISYYTAASAIYQILLVLYDVRARGSLGRALALYWAV